jgi:hypothetical protein
MSAGMPVFCTQREWLNDYFQPFMHYVPLAQGDVPAMTETLRKFLATPEALCTIGEQGKEETKRELNTKKFADDLYKIFLESYA